MVMSKAPKLDAADVLNAVLDDGRVDALHASALQNTDMFVAFMHDLSVRFLSKTQ